MKQRDLIKNSKKQDLNLKDMVVIMTYIQEDGMKSRYHDIKRLMRS